MKNIARYSSALALLMLMSSTQVALAEPADRFAYGERVDFAGVVWLTETEHSTTTLEIHLFNRAERSSVSGPVSYKGPGIVLFYTHRESDPETGAVTEINYEGFAGGAGATFVFDRSLSGALATFSLQLYGWTCVYSEGDGPAGTAPAVECDEIGEPTVEAQIAWTGVGPIMRQANNARSSEPPSFVAGSHSVLAIRDAEVVGTVAGDGIQLADGAAAFGVLLRGKYHEQMVMPR